MPTISLLSSQPFTETGLTYDRLQVSLNIQSTLEGQIMANLKLTPVAKNDLNETVAHPNIIHSLPISDLEKLAAEDESIAQAASHILYGLQLLVNLKGY